MTRLLTIIITLSLPLLLWAASGISALHWESLGNDVEAFDSMMERAAFMDIPRRDLRQVVSRLAGSSRSHHTQAEARSNYWRAWILLKENPDSASSLVDKALRICDSVEYPYDYARFKMLSADIMRQRGNLAEAYSIYRNQIKMLQKLNDRFWEAKALVSIGVIMQDLGELHEALRNYSEAQEIFSETGSLACVTKNRINLANMHYMLGNKTLGLEYLRNLESDRYVINDSVYMANVLVSRFHISDFTDRNAALMAYEIGEKLNNDALLVLTNFAMGCLNHNDGDEANAIKFLNRAVAKARAISDFNNQKRALELLESIYRSMHLNDSANQYRLRLSIINDSIYKQEKIDQIRRTEHLATITKYEQKIQAEADNHHRRQTLTLIVGGFILVILSLSICLLWAARKRTEAGRRLEEEKNERLALLNRQYSLEIEAKEKELTSNTMLLAQKNAKLKQLGEQIRDMERSGELRAEESEAINLKISTELKADDDWRYFKLKFEEVHPHFFSSIQEAYPSLSRTELRLCAYIRVGMNAKEIAQVLSVLPQTVNTSRYRIRKKMGLGLQDSLESVIEQF